MDINHTPLSPGSALSRKSTARAATQAASRGSAALTGSAQSSPAKLLSVGQTIQGEVTDLRNRQATITMEDGSRITARLENGAQLSIGDIASFQVQDVSSGSILLKLLPMSESLVASNAIMKALEEAGLPRNEKNIAVVRQLIEHQMPINKQSIQLLLRQSYQFREADLSTLVLMNRHHIPVTEGNVTQFQAYRNGEHPLLNKLSELSQEIPQLLSALTEENSGEILGLFGQELLSVLPQGSSSEGHSPAPSIAFLSPEERTALVELLGEEALSEEAAETILNGSASAKAVLSLLPEEALSHPAAVSLQQGLRDYQTETGQLLSFLTPEELEAFVSQTEDYPFSPAFQELLASGEASASEALAALRHVLPELSGEQVATLFRSPSFQKLLQENILSGWTLDVKELTKENSLEKLYETMQEGLSSLEKLLKGALPDSEAAASLSAKAQNVQQNVDFMHLLNQFFSYVQLPLQIKKQLTHGDLYVFTKKKGVQKKDQPITLLLHLDMQNLGALDIHLSLQRNEISSAFYVNDRSVERLLQRNIEELSQALAQKGFLFSSSFSIRERPLDIVRDFIEKEDPPAGMKRYSFDIRA